MQGFRDECVADPDTVSGGAEHIIEPNLSDDDVLRAGADSQSGSTEPTERSSPAVSQG